MSIIGLRSLNWKGATTLDAIIKALPDDHDREVVRIAASTWLETRDHQLRQTLTRRLKMILDQYGISKIISGDLCVRRLGNRLKIDVTKRITGNQCPDCKADIYQHPGDVRILYIQEGFSSDRVYYGCLCGAVFSKLEWKEE